MPRSVATILGLVLVACSIGFNVVRYPAVWKMASPAQAKSLAKAAQPEKTANHAPVPNQIDPVEVSPSPAVAGQAAAGEEQSAAAEPIANPNTEDRQLAASAELESQMSLVPIVRASLTDASAARAISGQCIHRLPPVALAGRNGAEPTPSLFPDNSIRIYPTTGIE